MAENKNRKILYVATVVKTHIMHFHLPYFEMLKKDGWQVDVAARNDYENPSDCKIPNCDNYFNIEFDRNPFSIANIRAYKELKYIIDNGEYDIVHCHTPVAGVLTRLAARGARNKGTKVFYTAHGFQFCKGAPLKDWILYYPVERFCARYTDYLITINHEDYDLVKNKFGKDINVVYVSGVGIDVEKYSNAKVDILKKKQELGIDKDAFVILSIGELIHRKNHIEAIKAIKNINTDKKLVYLIAGSGELKDTIQEYIKMNNLDDKIKLLGYRRDAYELYKIADLYLMPSKREGLAVSLMEALASGDNVICTDVRGCRDLVDESCTYPLGDVKKFTSLIVKYIENPEEKFNYDDRAAQFDVKPICQTIKELYSKSISNLEYK